MQLKFYQRWSIYTAEILFIEISSLRTFCLTNRDISSLQISDFRKFVTTKIKWPTQCAERLSILPLKSSWGGVTTTQLIGLASALFSMTCLLGNPHFIQKISMKFLRTLQASQYHYLKAYPIKPSLFLKNCSRLSLKIDLVRNSGPKKLKNISFLVK